MTSTHATVMARMRTPDLIGTAARAPEQERFRARRGTWLLHVIRSRRDIRAPSHVVHELITDVETWCLWSPHVAAVDPPTGRLAAGWSGKVRAWFAPPTTMTVIWAEPGRGMGWETPALGHVLVYHQRIEPGENGCRVTFEAHVEGPAGEWITRLAAPLSSLGQRRRLARLGLLAEWHARHQPSPY
jgi:hypothetical protein